MSLPIGWGDRNNQMSEKDLKLGGDAATKFAHAKNAYSNEDGTTGSGTVGYKTSEQVKAFYMQQIEHQQQQKQKEPQLNGELISSGNSNDATNNCTTASSLPAGWEDRQKNRALEAQQFGVFSSKTPPVMETAKATSSSSSTTLPSSAEAALVKVATSTLDTMAATLEQNPVALSAEERAAFAAAMQRAMTAIAKCR